jgi:hypothetical protein
VDRFDYEGRMYVDRVVRHAEYDANTHYSDVALLHMSEGVAINDYARPACLIPEERFDYEDCFTTGWGNDETGV